ncbi:Sec34-like family-domain-containing protein [Lipomyces orientalis]|uniref:Sec34-like family-domain-containing protein n=1 Tax=Lipomyces orientalis TaxID=1233043 RepID=A0ACC3TEZ8_9ASCO
MYDDWAYHVSPSQYAPQPQQKHRRRRKSILQDVALEHVQQTPDSRNGATAINHTLQHVAEEVTRRRQQVHEIPEYSVPIRRSNSMSGLRKLTSDRLGDMIKDGAASKSITYPFTLKEEQMLLNPPDSEFEFTELYESLEKELQDVNDRVFVLFRNTAHSHLKSCEILIGQANKTLEMFDTLASGFDSVKRQTSTFQDACDSLSNEQLRLETLANDLEAHLKPFNMLEEITRRLNAPGTDFVKEDGFKRMLESLDQCIQYVETHPNFNSVDLYQMRFRQCMTRALTLIRVYFVNSIRDVTNDVQSRIAAKALNDATQSALFYTKFRVDAPLLQSLTSEIQTRCEGHEEYASLLGDCYKAYIYARKKLITPAVAKRVNDMRNSLVDLLQLTRQSIAYMRTVCIDEYDLFYAIFTEGEEVVYDLLEGLCEPLHDVLRNRIIHEKKAEVLYELCSLLQGLSSQEAEEMEEGYFDRPQLDFGRLFQSTLQDAQVKLVFRMQAYS